MLLVLWSCGYDRRASSGRAWGVSLLDRWIVGSLAGWRVGGKKGRRDRGSSILSSTVLEVREDARMRGYRLCVRVRTGSVTGLYTEIIGIGSRKLRTVTVA